MNRVKPVLFATGLALLGWALIQGAGSAPVAQALIEEPAMQQTPEVPGVVTLTPAAPTLAPQIDAQGTPIDLLAVTLTANAFTSTPLPTNTPDPGELLFGDALPVLVAARADLETLADSALGVGVRPEGWAGSRNTADPQFPLLLRLDLELLSGVTLSATSRPIGWFGPIPSTPYALARDARHDLELLADGLGQINVRPAGWLGDDPIMRCGRGTQALVLFLERSGLEFTVTADTASPDFCSQAELQAAVFAEQNLLRDPTLMAAVAQGRNPADVQASNFAVGFLDQNAARNVGQIPLGTVLTPIARSYTSYSRMMLVRGEGFEVFVQYDFTTITDADWQALPDVATVGAAPFCQAAWCQ